MDDYDFADIVAVHRAANEREAGEVFGRLSLRPLTWDVLRRARQNAERHNDGCICPRCRDA